MGLIRVIPVPRARVGSSVMRGVKRVLGLLVDCGTEAFAYGRTDYAYDHDVTYEYEYDCHERAMIRSEPNRNKPSE